MDCGSVSTTGSGEASTTAATATQAVPNTGITWAYPRRDFFDFRHEFLDVTDLVIIKPNDIVNDSDDIYPNYSLANRRL